MKKNFMLPPWVPPIESDEVKEGGSTSDDDDDADE